MKGKRVFVQMKSGIVSEFITQQLLQPQLFIHLLRKDNVQIQQIKARCSLDFGHKQPHSAA